MESVDRTVNSKILHKYWVDEAKEDEGGRLFVTDWLTGRQIGQLSCSLAPTVSSQGFLQDLAAPDWLAGRKIGQLSCSLAPAVSSQGFLQSVANKLEDKPWNDNKLEDKPGDGAGKGSMDLISLNSATGLSRLPWRVYVDGGGRVGVGVVCSMINFASAAMNEVRDVLMKLHDYAPVKHPSPGALMCSMDGLLNMLNNCSIGDENDNKAFLESQR